MELLKTKDYLLELCSTYSVKRIGYVDGPIVGKMRKPSVKMILGESGEVTFKENNINYNIDLTKIMFCKGNFKEKKRVSSFNCSNEVIVDMFAGVGYFALQFLVHAGAKLVYACDINPLSIQYLRKNIYLNKIPSDKIIILQGDSLEVTPFNVADRVYMGLIPECRSFIKNAIDSLIAVCGIIHLHENVVVKKSMTDDFDDSFEFGKIYNWGNSKTKQDAFKTWGRDIVKYMSKEKPMYTFKLVNVNLVKSYAPNIFNLVADVEVRK